MSKIVAILVLIIITVTGCEVRAGTSPEPPIYYPCVDKG